MTITRPGSGAVILSFFCFVEACFAVTAVALCIAEFVIHRPIRILVPSVYWPIARLGLRRGRKTRRIFHLLIGKLYRKHFWNPAANSILKQRGFERQRHLSSCNIHAACSAMTLTVVAFFLYNHFYAGALVMVSFEMVFNTPAIILSRYLYLLTFSRKMSRGPNPAGAIF
jgi:hypothetical protein